MPDFKKLVDVSAVTEASENSDTSCKRKEDGEGIKESEEDKDQQQRNADKANKFFTKLCHTHRQWDAILASRAATVLR